MVDGWGLGWCGVLVLNDCWSVMVLVLGLGL